MIDWLIEGALIVDGTGAAPFAGDIAIEAGKIVEIGRLKHLQADHRIDAKERIVAPGFIDMHSHSDVFFLNGDSMAHKIHQGVTTELIGQDGISATPVTEASREALKEILEPLAGRREEAWKPWDTRQFLQTLETKKSPLNVATLVGHCNLRLAVMGHRMALPSPAELKQMEELLDESLSQGAMGLSLGLIYPPSSYSDTKELIALGKVVKASDALLVVHMRNEQDQISQSIDEMITVGKQSGCRIHISHLKCVGKRNWGKMTKALKMLEHGAQQGVDLSFDQYPYEATCTSLSVLLPGWALEGGSKGFEHRLRSPEIREKMLAAVGKSIEDRGGAASITIASVSSSENQEWVGKTLEEIGACRGLPSDGMALEMLVQEQLQVVAIYHSLSLADVEDAMRHPLHTVGSDGIMGEFPHPRTYGTFPRILHHFSRQRKLFSLEEAIRKMTSAPAKRLGLKNRGQIAPGYCADVVLFSPDNFRDTATFQHPKQLASGLDWFFVNGRPVIEEGKTNDHRPGRVLR